MAKARKAAPADLPAQRDPTAPLDAAAFLRAAQPTLRRLTEDLLTRADASPRVTAALKRQHAAALKQHRTAEEYIVWRRAVVTQVAAAWLLSCVFIRVLEDRGLIHARLAGPTARDSEANFFQFAPSLTHREYLLTIFRELSRLPAAAELFDAKHNLVWRLAPSDAACKDLLNLFRTPSIEAPAFRFGQPDTRFLGDLYQDLDADVRDYYALLQTPDFVESFILDHTLEPAIREYGIDHADIIDPTCGSGHFLLGAFPRLLDHLRRAHPAEDDRELARRALDKIYGVDINPYAASIARFRLFLKFVEVGQYRTLRETPKPPIHVVPADSLLYGFAGGQGDFSEREEGLAAGFGEGFNLEDAEGARQILAERRYTAVVGNPPYITVKDAALREKYRDRYSAAAGKYALSAPFMQRFFALGKSEGGYIGQITSNSFMKRDFGKALIEKVLRELELTYIVNTSGAFIPGHDTPTLIIFGRNRKLDLLASRGKVLAVLAKRGEPGTPDLPAEGFVWRSVVEHGRQVGFENEYISAEEVERSVFDKHPWTLEGGGASSLKDYIEQKAPTTLGTLAEDIGFASFTGLDDVFLLPTDTGVRNHVEPTTIRPMVIGESIRDWGISTSDESLCPFDVNTQEPIEISKHPGLHKFLWPYRASLESVTSFGGKTRGELGEVWWHWYRWQAARYRAPYRLSFAFVATHNNFILDRGGYVFKQSAPIIKLSAKATEDDHLALLAYLNSSVTCFWMKQVCYPKSTSNKDVNTEKGKPEENRYEFAGNLLGKLPLPDSGKLAKLVPFARALERMQRHRAALSPEQVIANALARQTDLADAVRSAVGEESRLLRRMISAQEDLDWAVYAIMDLVPRDLATETPQEFDLSPDERPFNAANPPAHLAAVNAPAFKLWKARAGKIQHPDSKQLRLVENPINKRPWVGARGIFGHKVATFEERCVTAAEEKIAELAEHVLRTSESVITRRALEQVLRNDPSYQSLHDLVTRHEAQRHPLAQQLERESVPYLGGYRYNISGREKFALWQQTWVLQRQADALDADAENNPTPENRHKATAFRAAIPVPPKYEPADFRDGNFFRLRGKLDVPKERFISYPGCASDTDQEPVFGWAGWNHLQRALALFQLYYARKDEAWTPDRLLPMLAGLEELLPWVRQWHADERSPETGQLYHEYFDQVIDSEAAELGFSRAQLADWAPPERSAGRKPARTARTADAEEDAEKPAPRARKARAAASPDETGEPAPARKPRKNAPDSTATDPPDAAPARKRRSKAADKTPPASE